MTAAYNYEKAARRIIEKMEGRDLYAWHLREVVENDFSIPSFARKKVISMCKEELGIKS